MASIKVKQKISGAISSPSKMSGTISNPTKMSGSMAIGTIFVSDEISEEDKYSGSYEVVPNQEEQVLKTAQKYMVKDVTIKEIPYAEVTNIANGTTVTIG